jgi:NADP-dependent 3-hydroxy acid dehydrogenase YdfG
LRKLNIEGWITVGVARDSTRFPQIADHQFEVNFDEPSMIVQIVYLISQQISDINFWFYAVGDITNQKASQTAPQDWQRIISANLSDAFYALQHNLPLLIENAHIFSWAQ